MPELGNKHECANCGTKFYDLGRPEPICPKCGANQRELAPEERSHAAALAARKRRAPRPEEIEEIETSPAAEVDEEILDEEDEEVLAEDLDEEIIGQEELGDEDI